MVNDVLEAPEEHTGLVDEFRRLLLTMPRTRSGYGPWWATPPGRAVVAIVRDAVARPVAAAVRARTGRGLGPEAVTGILVEAFAPPSTLVRALGAESTDNPLAYLSRSLANALAREEGSDWDALPSLPGEEGYGQAATGRGARLVDMRAIGVPGSAPDGGSGPSLEAAADTVVAVLAPSTPARLRTALPEIVDRVIDLAVDGSLSRLHTRAARDPELLQLGWTADEIRALVNVVIGARPEHGRASLVAGFLANPQWRPRTSPVHRGALHAYERRLARAEARAAASSTSSGHDVGDRR